MILKLVIKLIQKLLIFGFFGLMIFGGYSIWVCITIRKPVTIDLASLAHGTNRASWLTVRDCEFSAIYAVGWTNRIFQSFQEVFIPVRTNPRDTNSPVPLLIALRERRILAGLNALRNADGAAAQLRTFADFPELGYTNRDVTGLVRSSWEINADETRAYRQAFPTLTQNFAVVDEGKSPSVIKGILLVGLGIVFLAVWGLLDRLLQKRARQPNLPPVIPVPPHIPPPLPRN